MSPTIETVINFLTTVYKTGVGYSCLNTARSAISSLVSIEGTPVGSHPLIVRLLKGMYNSRPSLPKTNVTWEPEILLLYLKTLSPVRRLSLKKLTYKTTTLLWLLSAQRGQTIQMIDIRNITLTKHVVKIRFGDILKTSRPGFQQSEISLKAFAPDRRICIVTVLQEYIRRTKDLRGEESFQLLISYQRPFEPVSRDTVSRWVKIVMSEAGIDTRIFTPHSVRSASVSAAHRAKVPLETILATAGWKKDDTFRKYYNKPLVCQDYSTKVIQGSAK